MSLKGLVTKSKTGVYSAKLGHGVCIAMVSDPKVESNFQRQFKHCIPPRKNITGYRFNITFRSKSPSATRTLAGVLASAESSAKLNESCYLSLWKDTLISKAQLELIHQELQALLPRMKADRTFVWGKWHDNQGRKVAELGWKAGTQYAYAGKTTAPGEAFSETLCEVVTQKIAPLFGVDKSEIWAHVVYYPPKSRLGWHSDAEKGIDPHFILSLTLLEDPVKGARDFQVKPITV